jgi:hypothetical protein
MSIHSRFASIWAAFVSIALASPAPARAEEKPGAAAPVKANQRWEGLDDRLDFLVTRLVNIEASLDAINAAIAKLHPADAKAGGENAADERPLDWQTFYAAAARKLFRGSMAAGISRATALLNRQAGSEAVGPTEPGEKTAAANDDEPPPNFAKYQRAFQKDKASAEAALSGNQNYDDLCRRRTSLEDEQCGVWCEITSRAIAGRELSKKPLYRFEAFAESGASAAEKQRAAAVKAAAVFMQTQLALVAASERDPAQTFAQTKNLVSEARERIDNRWLRMGTLADDIRDVQKPIGQFSALAKQVSDAASNLTDCYHTATDPQLVNDPRRQKFRAMLQQAAIHYAEIVVALDDVLGTMAGKWQLQPDPNSPLSFPVLSELAAAAGAEKPAAGRGANLADKKWKVYKPNDMKTAYDLGARAQFMDSGVEFLRGALGQELATATSRDEFKLPLEVEFTVTAFQDGGFDVWPQVGDVKLEWGTGYNRDTFVYVKDIRYTIPHVRIVPGQENVIRFLVDKDSHVVITINDSEALNRKVDVELPAEAKIILGGGIGHSEYRQVRVRTAEGN